MQGFIDAGELSGLVALVADEKNILHLSALGERDLAQHLPMEPDTMFWIASMTKPVTAVAIMMLAEENKLRIDHPVSRFIPEFSNLKNPSKKTAHITLRHLLTHTSGLSEAPGEKAFQARNLAELMPLFLSLPLKFEPGTKWDYCQSAINTLGRIVEIVSGQNFAEFLQQRLFNPLDMKDATFTPTAEQISRLAIPYLRERGKLVPTDRYLIAGPKIAKGHYPAAHAGLYCTAIDYCHFSQMLLAGGEFQGRKLLTSDSVAELTRPKTSGLDAGFVPGSQWGLGVGIVTKPTGTTKTLSPGTYGHGGAFGTQAWIDPIKSRVQILLIQRADVGNGDDSIYRRTFHAAVQDSLHG